MTLEGHDCGVLKCLFRSTDEILSVSADGVMKIWSVKTYENLNTIEVHEAARCWALNISADGYNIVTGANDSKLKIWEDNTAKILLEKETETDLHQKELTDLENAVQSGE